ncbi:MAG: hypothetical protein DMG93_07980 [Acidobacteria bacterium]|nr:MAG: hypothetical protein DMG93_07980 [Acidobacteriota bacterium]
MASDGFDIPKAVEAITRWPPGEQETSVAKELSTSLCERGCSCTIVAGNPIRNYHGFRSRASAGNSSEISASGMAIEDQLPTL